MAEYTIPLRKGYHQVPRHKRSKKAVSVLREFLKRHTKADEVKIGQHLNEHIWARGIRNPPGKVTVTTDVTTIDGVKVARCELLGKDFAESVRPEERTEEEGGLKGKLQAMTQAKEEKAEEKPAPKTEKAAEKPKAEETAQAAPKAN